MAQAKMKVNVLVPMAGEGSRFKKNGYHRPKPFIDVAGKPMIEWVFDNFISDRVDIQFIVVIRTVHDKEWNIADQLREVVPNVKIVYCEKLTEGAACTTLLAKDLIDNNDPLLIVNSDQFLRWDVDRFWDQLAEEGKQKKKHGNILCFHHPMELNDTKWSYAKVDGDGHVTEVKEKIVISPHATVGVYYWTRGLDYVSCAEEMIRKDIRVKGEFYVAPVYEVGVARGMKFTLSFCDAFYGLGVPADLTHFLDAYVKPRRRMLLQRRRKPSKTKEELMLLTHAEEIRFIAHRGNLKGPNKARENHPEYLKEALDAGFDVELDVWYLPDKQKWMLGHDEPQYETTLEFLRTPRLWIHCKNGDALQLLSAERDLQVFFHNVDDFTLTSKGMLWTYPDKPLYGKRSIAVMFTDPAACLNLEDPPHGICADNVAELRSKYLNLKHKKRREQDVALDDEKKGDQNAERKKRRIRAIIFDLDGVLVESKDIHYVALNDALRSVAGPDYIISRSEHESIYDGLSTNQKLVLLAASKGLEQKFHRDVWIAKQSRTQELFAAQIKEDPAIMHTLSTLRELGYPIVCASNCIQSSVVTLLTGIGAMPYIDAFFSNESVKNPKPSGDLYRHAAAMVGCTTDEVVIVEDSVKGFEAAIRAGGHLLQVKDPSEVTVPRILDFIERMESKGLPDLNVVMPLARPGLQYWINGVTESPHEVPLQLADVDGQPLLKILCDNIRAPNLLTHFTFLCRPTHIERFELHRLLPHITSFSPTQLVELPFDQLGATKTCLLAQEHYNTDAPLLIHDVGHLIEWDNCKELYDVVMNDPDCIGAVTTHTHSNPNFSYVQVDNKNRVLQIKEKTVLSDQACTGMYMWRHGSDFVKYANRLIADNETVRGQFYLAPVFAKAIEDNKKVVSHHVGKVFMLKGTGDVQQYVLQARPRNVKGQLDAIYAEMIERQTRTVLSMDSVPGDPLLQELKDDRRCHAVYTIFDSEDNWHPSVTYTQAAKEVSTKLLPGHVHYQPLPAGGASKPLDGFLHFTFMSLIGFDDFRGFELPPNYYEAVQAVLVNYCTSFFIRFHSLVVTPTNIVMIGTPSTDVNWHRDVMRREMGRCGLLLMERYKANIVHTTLVRFAKPLLKQELVKAVAWAEKYRDVDLGYLEVNKLHISSASWRMQPEERQDKGKVVAELSK